MKIRIIYLEDWEALYIDDKLIMENHSLDITDLIPVINPGADLKTVFIENDDCSFFCPSEWTDELEKSCKDE